MTNTETVSAERLEELLRLEIGERDRYLEGTFLWLKHDDKAKAFAELIAKRTLASRTQSPAAEWQVEAAQAVLAKYVEDRAVIREALCAASIPIQSPADFMGLAAHLAKINAGRPVIERESDGAVFVHRDICIEAMQALRASSIPAPERSKEETGVRVDEIAKIIDPHSFFPIGELEPDDHWTESMVEQGIELARSKARRILSALETPPLHKEEVAAKHSDACGCGYCT